MKKGGVVGIVGKMEMKMKKFTKGKQSIYTENNV